MISLRRYDWTFHLLVVALCSYFLARAVTVYVASVIETSSESQETKPITAPAPAAPVAREEVQTTSYQIILDRNIFNSAESAVSKETPVGELSPDQLGELGPAVKSSLDVKLLGTLVVGEGTDSRSSATISGGKNSKGVDVYYPGDEKVFSPNIKLTKVALDRIEFVNGGRLEYIEVEDFASKRSIFASATEVHGGGKAIGEKEDKRPATGTTEGSKIIVDQREVDDAIQNLDKLYSEVRIVPNIRDGQPAGMKVLAIKPGSMLTKLGVRRGDVLEKVNGQELDIRRGMELFSQMKDMKNFSLDVSRGGKNQTIEYEIR